MKNTICLLYVHNVRFTIKADISFIKLLRLNSMLHSNHILSRHRTGAHAAFSTAPESTATRPSSRIAIPAERTSGHIIIIVAGSATPVVLAGIIGIVDHPLNRIGSIVVRSILVRPAALLLFDGIAGLVVIRSTIVRNRTRRQYKMIVEMRHTIFATV